MRQRVLIVFLLLFVSFESIILAQHVEGQSNAFNQTFLMEAKTGNSCGSMREVSVHDAGGRKVVGTVTATSQINLYILTEAQFNAFAQGQRKGNGNVVLACGTLLPQSSELSVLGLTNYSLNYDVPDSSRHYIVVINILPSDTTVSVSLSWG